MVQNDTTRIRNWCEAHLPAERARQLDCGDLPTGPIYQELARQGWSVPVLTGDRDGLQKAVDIIRIVAGYSGTLANAVAVNSACATMLLAFGSDSWKQTAGRILAGEQLASFCLTEPQAGSDVRNLQTRGTQTEDGAWSVTGTKYFATGAAEADWLLVVARTSDERPVHQAVTVFGIPADTPGVSLSPMPKMASNGFASCEVVLENVHLTDDHIVGAAHSAWKMLALTGGAERLLVAASCIGVCETMESYVLDFAGERTVAGEPILGLQTISHRLVDMHVKIQAARGLLSDAVHQLAAGTDASKTICMAKLFASEIQQEIALDAMKIIGGRAYLQKSPVERWFREGLLSLYAGGTNEIQRNLIAGRLATGSS